VLDKFSIIKKHIDQMDCYGLLGSDAPADEFDIESQIIADAIIESSTIQEIATIIAGVFNRQFSDNRQPDCFMGCAGKIYCDLHTTGTEREEQKDQAHRTLQDGE